MNTNRTNLKEVVRMQLELRTFNKKARLFSAIKQFKFDM